MAGGTAWTGCWYSWSLVEMYPLRFGLTNFAPNFQEVTMHEIGHSLGFEHDILNTESVMTENPCCSPHSPALTSIAPIDRAKFNLIYP